MERLYVFLWSVLFPLLGARQSCWRSLVGTSLRLIQWHPSRLACPSPGLETKTGTRRGSRRLPAAVCPTLRLRPAASRARAAGRKYECFSEFYQGKSIIWGWLGWSLKCHKLRYYLTLRGLGRFPSLSRTKYSDFVVIISTKSVKLIRNLSRYHYITQRSL